MSELKEHDVDAVSDAVAALEDAGFSVEGLDDVERVNHGVRFSVTAEANTRTKPLDGGE